MDNIQNKIIDNPEIINNINKEDSPNDLNIIEKSKVSQNKNLIKYPFSDQGNFHHKSSLQSAEKEIIKNPFKHEEFFTICDLNTIFLKNPFEEISNENDLKNISFDKNENNLNNKNQINNYLKENKKNNLPKENILNSIIVSNKNKINKTENEKIIGKDKLNILLDNLEGNLLNGEEIPDNEFIKNLSLKSKIIIQILKIR